MQRHIYAVGIMLLALAAGVTEGCSGGGGKVVVTPTNSPQNFANIRFINGTIGVPGTSIVPQTSLNVLSAIPIGNVSAYNPVLASNQTFAFTIPATPYNISCATPYSLSPESYYTIVVVGNPTLSGNQGLQCQIFLESYQIPQSGMGQLLFHVASPQLALSGIATISVGTIALPETATTSYASILGTAQFASTLLRGTVTGTTLDVDFPAVTTGAGMAFFASTATGGPAPSASATPTPAPSPLATIKPMNAYMGAGNIGALPDPNNWFPVASSNTISIYVLDSTYVPAGTSTAPQVSLMAIID